MNLAKRHNHNNFFKKSMEKDNDLIDPIIWDFGKKYQKTT